MWLLRSVKHLFLIMLSICFDQIMHDYSTESVSTFSLASCFFLLCKHKSSYAILQCSDCCTFEFLVLVKFMLSFAPSVSRFALLSKERLSLVTSAPDSNVRDVDVWERFCLCSYSVFYGKEPVVTDDWGLFREKLNSLSNNFFIAHWNK